MDVVERRQQRYDLIVLPGQTSGDHRHPAEAERAAGLSLLDEHVIRFNHGVRTGDWTRMLELFYEDADLVFTGIPVGPFHGRDAIRRAYTEQPPDDEVVLLRRIGDDAAEYAWARDPSRVAGGLHLVVRDGAIASIRIDYETHP